MNTLLAIYFFFFAFSFKEKPKSRTPTEKGRIEKYVFRFDINIGTKHYFPEQLFPTNCQNLFFHLQYQNLLKVSSYIYKTEADVCRCFNQNNQIKNNRKFPENIFKKRTLPQAHLEILHSFSEQFLIRIPLGDGFCQVYTRNIIAIL